MGNGGHLALRLNLKHLLILLAILAASVGFGFASDGILTAWEKHTHPRPEEFREEIAQNAQEYALPEAILWASACVESNFASNAKGEDGSIGLLQIHPDRFAQIRKEILELPPIEGGMLYDPATNLQSGAAYLSHLYHRYGVWDTVFAAWATDEKTVDAWLKDPAYTNDGGTLSQIPDAAAKDFVEQMRKAVALYTKLYY